MVNSAGVRKATVSDTPENPNTPDPDAAPILARCAACDAILPIAATACPACGLDLSNPDAVIAEYHRRPGPIARAAALIILSAIVVGLVAAIWIALKN